MRDLMRKAQTNILRFQFSNATILQDLSRQILEAGVDNFDGEGSLLYEEYLQLVKECFPPSPSPSNSPTTAPTTSPSNSPTTSNSPTSAPTTSPPSSASQHLSTRIGIFLSMSAGM